MKAPATFVRRRPELLALEGWYDTGSYQFKLSCRFHDLLRCSQFNGKPAHFSSCFAKDRCHSGQSLRRCLNPNWAIIYVPDKHGNYLGRAFAHYEEGCINEKKEAKLVVDKIYGNRLTIEDIMKMIKNKVIVVASHHDTYLARDGS